MANVLVRIDVQDQAAAPLNGVTVRVYQADGTTFITEGVTGAPFVAGRVEFTLFGDNPAVDYVIRLSINGYHFPAGAAQTISVSDPPAPDNDFGPYTAQQGSTAILVTFDVVDDQVPAQPLNGVQIRIYSALDVFLTQISTDAGGIATVALPGTASPGTTYIARFWAPGVIFPNPTQTIAVIDPLVPPETNIFDIVGEIPGPYDSADPDLCTVYGEFTDFSLRPAKRLVLEFKSRPRFEDVTNSVRLLGGFYGEPTLVRSNMLARGVKVETDVRGHMQVELPRLGFFEVHIHGLEDPFEITERIFIPDAASFRLDQLLWPYVSSVVYGSDPIVVVTGAEVTVPLTVTLSNTETVDDLGAISDLLEFTPADPAIVEVSLFYPSSLKVKGLQVGSTTIVATRKANKVVPSRPDIAAITVTPPTVNVS